MVFNYHHASILVLTFTSLVWMIQATEYPDTNSICNSLPCPRQSQTVAKKTDLLGDFRNEQTKPGHFNLRDHTSNSSTEILLHSQKYKRDSVMFSIDSLRRSSEVKDGQVCPELNTACPDLIQYPNCNMYRITNVCPWKYVDKRAVCVTKQPCYNIDKSHPNLQCKQFYLNYRNEAQLPVACLAVKVETELSNSLLG